MHVQDRNHRQAVMIFSDMIEIITVCIIFHISGDIIPFIHLKEKAARAKAEFLCGTFQSPHRSESPGTVMVSCLKEILLFFSDEKEIDMLLTSFLH